MRPSMPVDSNKRVAHSLKECSRGVHLHSSNHWAHAWVDVPRSLWRTTSATPDLRLPSRPHSTSPWSVLMSRPAEGRSVGGWVGLSGWLHTKTVYPRTVTHLSTNRARCRATSLMRPTTLPLGHASTVSRLHGGLNTDSLSNYVTVSSERPDRSPSCHERTHNDHLLTAGNVNCGPSLCVIHRVTVT